jgi:hypothetical protein
LTNNAVQKEAKNYGILYEGNQISLEQTVEYLNNQGGTLTLNHLLDSMKKIVFESLSSVKDRLIENNHHKNFQLLGYDFLMDSNYKLWLI